MTMLGFLSITGDEQGVIQGGSTHEDNLDDIEILKFDHQVEIPSGAVTQLSAGQPIHGGIKINKIIDKSTPKLAQALCNREILSEVEISYYHHTQSGTRELSYKVVLKNALITKISSWTPHFFESQEEQYRLMEDVVFSYEKILWSWGSEGDVEYEVSSKGAE